MSKHTHVSLPDFRNLGVILRSLVLAEGVVLLVVLANADTPADALADFAGSGVLREPVLLVSACFLALFSPALGRRRYGSGVALAIGLVFLIGLGMHLLCMSILPVPMAGAPWRTGALAACVGATVLFYFNWRYHVLSPALVEARLMALQARIRPHFLFNSLNTVLGLIRSEPRQAETVLEIWPSCIGRYCRRPVRWFPWPRSWSWRAPMPRSRPSASATVCASSGNASPRPWMPWCRR
ncbi:histidine kinase [Parasulfuritortus cantonensis]|uniref:Histidine kinase n=1 Tax=Parasulfuritortus cantonensis TaxID=2528202 RepID=A0A4R1BCJ3_9PROT|nr:histidine kinase [Parasulfuritortus cantonensis]